SHGNLPGAGPAAQTVLARTKVLTWVTSRSAMETADRNFPRPQSPPRAEHQIDHICRGYAPAGESGCQEKPIRKSGPGDPAASLRRIVARESANASAFAAMQRLSGEHRLTVSGRGAARLPLNPPPAASR